MNGRPPTLAVPTAMIALVLLLSGIDFLLFVRKTRELPKIPAYNALAKPEAVVALTGGNGLRIALAVAYARPRRLPILISGVHPDAELANISAMSGVEQSFLTCCIQIGREARDTAGNGRELARWARQAGYRVIVLVTSDYHIQRALIEAKSAMPEASFVPLAAPTNLLRARNWWLDTDYIWLLVREWAKLKISTFNFALSRLYR